MLADLLQAAGAVLVCVALWLVWAPLGLAAAGVALIAAGVAVARDA